VGWFESGAQKGKVWGQYVPENEEIQPRKNAEKKKLRNETDWTKKDS
jgi:hypothetical protein